MADLIARDILMAKMLLQHEDYNRQGATDMALGYGSAICDVRQAPAVDAEPVKRGKWITCDDGWGGVHYQCSACGNEWYLEDGTPEENGMNYCPHCGAKNGGMNDD